MAASPSPGDSPLNKGNVPFEVHPRADAIRSKLIYIFYLIDHLRGLSHAVPRHNIQDFLDKKKLRKLMLTDHHQLVRFNIAPSRKVMVSQEKRWRNRIEVRCSHWPPLTMWASSILNSNFFKGFIIFLIFLNMLVLMISTEIVEMTGQTMVNMKIAVEVVIWVIVFIFMAEIGLHWIVSFWRYWNNPWNIFDFTVTLVSFIPELIYLSDKSHSVAAVRLLQVCRVLRCLKLFSRVRQVRVLIMAIAKALKAMAFILVLLLFFLYVFAVSGIFFFESYSRSDRDDLTFNMYFTDMPNSLVTVFILFTMDHWYALLQDTWKVPEINKVISGLFVCLWLLIGAFIFRNLFVAIMVTNFQNIRSDLSEEVHQIETQKQADKFKMELLERRYSTAQAHFDRLSTAPERQSTETTSVVPFTEYPEYSSHEFHTGILDWETYIYKNLPGLYEADEDEQVVWPRDSLFRYFELLEKLQYNLDERKQLQQYAVLALSNLEDK
ncbi:cation channel sperm-associated protein 2 [Varanus komodoensis]|uniref:cation channel sperm-associated protein 2 n=1 Tax=Varanus komodoensis TaxID=61221 RepID=UPI001CF77A57|nr:cation channel sperm-associated protein 2 [Varanus komodoensis]